MAKRARRQAWRKTAVETNRAIPLLKEAGVIDFNEAPTDVQAWFDKGGRLRRVDARYSNGWRAVVHFCADGTVSVSQSLKMKVVGQ